MHEVESSKEDFYYLEILARNVKNVEFWSKSDPFLIFYKPIDSKSDALTSAEVQESEWKMVKKTEYIKNNLNPIFIPFFIPCVKMNNGDPNMIQRVEIWDHSKKGEHERIGIGYFHMSDLLTDKNLVRCYNNKKTKSNGDLIFTKVCKVGKPSFLTLHKSGIIRIKTHIYIDFTMDNGSPTYPTSGHYVNRNGERNTYEKFIGGIVDALGFLSNDINDFMSALQNFTIKKNTLKPIANAYY